MIVAKIKRWLLKQQKWSLKDTVPQPGTFPINSTVADTEIESERTSTEATNTVTSKTTVTIATTNGYVNKWVRNLIRYPTNRSTSFTAGAWP